MMLSRVEKIQRIVLLIGVIVVLLDVLYWRAG
jgi:hypothetical protein